MSTSRDTGSGTIKRFDPENMGITVGILLLRALELEICLGARAAQQFLKVVDTSSRNFF